MKTKAEVENLKNVISSNYQDLTFYEVNRGRRDGLFTKYLWAFNERGENVSVQLATFLNWRMSRARNFRGCLMSGGYGFTLASYIIGALERQNYQSVRDLP